jgi:hypothetical protein
VELYFLSWKLYFLDGQLCNSVIIMICFVAIDNFIFLEGRVM